MKLSGGKALEFCNAPKKGLRAVLLFGADGGVVSDASQALIKSWIGAAPDPLDVTQFREDVLKKEPAALFDALSAQSLLGGVPLIVAKIDGDGAAKTLVDAVGALESGEISTDAFWLVEGPDLPPKSKIRKAFEAATNACALHLFADTEEAVGEMTLAALKDTNAEIDADALELFVSELPGDRHLAKAEIEKLSLYAMGLGRPIRVSDVDLIAASEQPRGADAAADAALAGDVLTADTATTRFLEAGGSPVSALRTLHFRLLRLSDAQAGAKYLRPPVFDRDRPAFNQTLQAWPPKRITRALAMLYAAEKTCKQAGAPAEAALKIVVDRLARRKI